MKIINNITGYYFPSVAAFSSINKYQSKGGKHGQQ